MSYLGLGIAALGAWLFAAAVRGSSIDNGLPLNKKLFGGSLAFAVFATVALVDAVGR
jgi:hypothetical protein